MVKRTKYVKMVKDKNEKSHMEKMIIDLKVNLVRFNRMYVECVIRRQEWHLMCQKLNQKVKTQI